MSKYKEIFKLKDMLDKENIEYEFCDRSEEFSVGNIHREHYQVLIYKNGERLVSVIEGYGTYGREQDRLEIMGLTEFEYDVEGWLSAEEVFKRIKANI
ncbi:MAG: hypothetical protein E7E92_08840 [Clostridiales bacterium]|nr:hypothetical protein [Clostridiales bacterium]